MRFVGLFKKADDVETPAENLARLNERRADLIRLRSRKRVAEGAARARAVSEKVAGLRYKAEREADALRVEVYDLEAEIKTIDGEIELLKREARHEEIRQNAEKAKALIEQMTPLARQLEAMDAELGRHLPYINVPGAPWSLERGRLTEWLRAVESFAWGSLTRPLCRFQPTGTGSAVIRLIEATRLALPRKFRAGDIAELGAGEARDLVEAGKAIFVDARKVRDGGEGGGTFLSVRPARPNSGTVRARMIENVELPPTKATDVTKGTEIELAEDAARSLVEGGLATQIGA